jgi:hypothetical protein
MSGVVVILGSSHVTADGVPLVQAVVPVRNDTDDVEQYGELEMFQCLGLTSLPWPKTKEGYAEGLAIVNVGGRDAVIVGARDVRTAKIVGKMQPGDTVVHSTGPKQSAQLQLKEKNRQAVLATKDSGGFDMMVLLDGKNDEAQVIAGGNVFKLSKKDGIVLADSTGGGIHIKDGVVRITGKELMMPGAAPNPAFKLMAGPATGSPGGPASVPMIAVKGVTIGV